LIVGGRIHDGYVDLEPFDFCWCFELVELN
jgi:hypothetical protein